MHWFWDSRITAVAPNAGYVDPSFSFETNENGCEACPIYGANSESLYVRQCKVEGPLDPSEEIIFISWTR